MATRPRLQSRSCSARQSRRAARTKGAIATSVGPVPSALDRVSEVTKADVDAARVLSAVHAGLSARDCRHVALMKRLGCTKIWSYDEGLDRVPSLQRIG